MTGVVATAHPNVALSKYWGKRPGLGNFPAVPSLSVTLAGLATRTYVMFDGALGEDAVVLNGERVSGGPRARAVALLDRVRAASGSHRFARVESTNDFPTASGLASSASGFAALALAATSAAGLDWSAEQVSDLARQSSASAARSLFGGFVELDAGPEVPAEDDFLAARPFAGANQLPLSVIICVTTEAPKSLGSTAGMNATLARSPYASAWLDAAPRVHARLRAALLDADFVAVGELAEASALAMHASAIAAGVMYWSPATLHVLEAVRAIRASGIAAFASIDAGPHVKVLSVESDRAAVRARLVETPGVVRLIDAHPGPAASVAPGRLGGTCG